MSNILVLIPLDPKLPSPLKERCLELSNLLPRANPHHCLEVLIDSRGPGRTENKLGEFVSRSCSLRQELIGEHLKPHHDYVFWIDADVIAYPADLPTKLIERNPLGISAPLILLEEHSWFFYDPAGFVEKGEWCRQYYPFFKQPGPIFDLDGVGCVYLVPASLYRDGARHEDAPGFTEHLSICRFARERQLPVRAYADLYVTHSFRDLWKMPRGSEKQELAYLRARVKTLKKISDRKDEIIYSLLKVENSLVWRFLKRIDKLMEQLFGRKVFNIYHHLINKMQSHVPKN